MKWKEGNEVKRSGMKGMKWDEDFFLRKLDFISLEILNWVNLFGLNFPLKF